jgi:hypothetical protein
MKSTLFGRFDAGVGTNGVGWAIFSPCIASDSPSALFTTGAYTGTVTTAFNSELTNCSTAFVNAPYTTAQLTSGAGNIPPNLSGTVQGRIVSFAASASYTGTTLNQSGIMCCYVSPQHQDVSSETHTTIQNFAETDLTNVMRQKCWVVAGCVNEEEASYDRSTRLATQSTGTPAYSTLMYPLSPFDSTNGILGSINMATPIIVISFTGVPLSTVHFDMVVHVEYIGLPAQAMLTPSVADPAGRAVVDSAIGKIPDMKMANPEATFSDLMFQAVREVVEELKPVGISILKEAAVTSARAMIMN